MLDFIPKINSEEENFIVYTMYKYYPNSRSQYNIMIENILRDLKTFIGIVPDWVSLYGSKHELHYCGFIYSDNRYLTSEQHLGL